MSRTGHDIALLAANAGVGYWRCPKPLKNRDVATLRSRQVEDGYRAVVNFSVKQLACVKYPAWKQEHNANMKPWLYPEENKLPLLAQHDASLENIDESGLSEVKDERGNHSSSEN